MATTETTTTGTTPLAHLPGHFYFADLHTDDVDGAAAFYRGLYGWEANEIPGAPMRYLPVEADGRGRVALTGLTPEQVGDGVQPYWFAYVYVADIDATCALVREHGGTIDHEPIDIFDMGRMAVATDPTGASFGIWQDLQEFTTVKDEPGAPFWYELHTRDAEAALAFYGAVLGWTSTPNQMGPDVTYHVLAAPSSDANQLAPGGLMQLMPDELAAGGHSYWAVYFNTDDCDATTALAAELGGSVVMEPMDIPGVGRASWVADPRGAIFAVMKATPPAG